MQVFKISIRLKRNGHWSIRKDDFTGYFVKRESDVIEGYMIDTHSSFPNFRYISGHFIDGKKLVFLKLTNDSDYAPRVYHFHNVNKRGFCYSISPLAEIMYQGHAKITLEEITDESEKQELADKASTVFEKYSADAHSLNIRLMSDFESIEDFVTSRAKN